MKTNMGNVDRLLRGAVAAVIGILWSSHLISGTSALVLLGLAGILALTSFIGVCPLYYPLQINTQKQS